MAAAPRPLGARAGDAVIRRLRVRHRRTIGVLSIVLPVLAILGLAARPDTRTPTLAREAWPASPADWTALGLEARTKGDTLEIRPGPRFEGADVLVYVASGPSTGTLPPDARLLGSLGDQQRAFALPDGLERASQRVVLFSLGHQEVVGEAALPRGP